MYFFKVLLFPVFFYSDIKSVEIESMRVKKKSTIAILHDFIYFNGVCAKQKIWIKADCIQLIQNRKATMPDFYTCATMGKD